MDADVCLWHKGHIELRHIKHLLTGAERTSHKHPLSNVKQRCVRDVSDIPRAWARGCQAVGRQSHWGVQTSDSFIEKNLKESAMPFLSFSCINTICRKPISTSSDALRNSAAKKRSGGPGRSPIRRPLQVNSS